MDFIKLLNLSGGIWVYFFIELYAEKYLKSGFVLAVEGSFIGLAAYHHFEAEKYYDRYEVAPESNSDNNIIIYQILYSLIGIFVLILFMSYYIFVRAKKKLK